MSRDNFLSLLQQLLTMVDKENPSSIALAKTILVSVEGLVDTTHKTDALTQRMIHIANHQFESLVRHQEDFAGVPGAYQENAVKRQRLMHMIMPGC